MLRAVPGPVEVELEAEAVLGLFPLEGAELSAVDYRSRAAPSPAVRGARLCGVRPRNNSRERRRRHGDLAAGAAVHQPDDAERRIDERSAGITGARRDAGEERVAQVRQRRASTQAIDTSDLSS